MKFLIFGDVVAKIGRRALIAKLPELKARYKPDQVIINAENLAHGKGITLNTIEEMSTAGVDIFTGGNHSFSKPEGAALFAGNTQLIRPANFVDAPGAGYRIYEVGGVPFVVINLLGRVFMKDEVLDPFHTFDTIVAQDDVKNIPIRLVDFHGETTAERNAFKWHIVDRASVLWGTHTHVQTNDAGIVQDRLGFITDVGMTGARDGVIGIKKEGSLSHFVTGGKITFDFDEQGPVIISGMFVEVSREGVCTRIEHFIEHTII